MTEIKKDGLSARQQNKVNELLNDLENKQQKITTGSMNAIEKSVKQEVVRRVKRIKNNVGIMRDAKSQIIDDLMYLKENQEELTQETGLTFEEFIKEVAGYSKGYFYKLTGNYEFLKSQDKIELLDKVDAEIINEIKRMDNPKLQKVYLDKAETLTRSDIEEMRNRVSPRDSENIIKTGEIINVTPIETQNNELHKYKIKVNKKITYQINMLESYIKQLRKKKKEKEYNEGQIMSYNIVITNLKELLKEL